MSVKLMALVWELDLSTFEKLVMLALADCANDDGECWPSVATLSRKTGAAERTVQRSLRALEQSGLLKTITLTGRGNRYWLNPRHSDTPATVTPPPRWHRTPATVTPHPRHSGTQTIIEPSRTIKGAKAPTRAREKFTLPDWVPAEPWAGFMEMRRDAGKTPTARAKGLLIAKLERLRDAGHDPGKVLDQSTERNWLGIFEVKGNGRQDDKRNGVARAIDSRLGFGEFAGTVGRRPVGDGPQDRHRAIALPAPGD